MQAFKIAYALDVRVLVTLEIPPDARTNCERASVAIPDTATYFTDCARVMKIEDPQSGTEYTEALGRLYESAERRRLVYKTGELVTSDFMNDPECAYGWGIEFYKNRSVAEMCGLGSVPNGVYRSWHLNGNLDVECEYTDGEVNGTFCSWFESGIQKFESHWVHGIRHGSRKEWYENGMLWRTSWFNEGQQTDGELMYDKDGNLIGETVYYNGIAVQYREWDTQGVLRHEEITPPDGNTEYHTWDSNGILQECEVTDDYDEDCY